LLKPPSQPVTKELSTSVDTRAVRDGRHVRLFFCAPPVMLRLMADMFRIDEERAARIAARRNEKQRAKYPLLADQLDETTAEQVKAAADRHADAFARCCGELQARGDFFREHVRLLINQEMFDE